MQTSKHEDNSFDSGSLPYSPSEFVLDLWKESEITSRGYKFNSVGYYLFYTQMVTESGTHYSVKLNEEFDLKSSTITLHVRFRFRIEHRDKKPVKEFYICGRTHAGKRKSKCIPRQLAIDLRFLYDAFDISYMHPAFRPPHRWGINWKCIVRACKLIFNLDVRDPHEPVFRRLYRNQPNFKARRRLRRQQFKEAQKMFPGQSLEYACWKYCVYILGAGKYDQIFNQT